jgi:hypothetical protein
MSFADYIIFKEHDAYIKVELVLYHCCCTRKQLIISSNVLFIHGNRQSFLLYIGEKLKLVDTFPGKNMIVMKWRG